MNTFPWKYELSNHTCSIYAGDLLTKYTNVSGTPLQIEAVTDTMLRIHTRTQDSFAVENRPASTGTLTAVNPCGTQAEKQTCDAASLPEAAATSQETQRNTTSTDVHENAPSLLTLATKALQISLDDQLHLQICSTEGTPLCSDYTGALQEAETLTEEEIEQMRQEGHVVHAGDDACRFQITKSLYGDEVFYGLGDKTGFLNKIGYDYTMWNSDNPDPHVENPTFKALYKSIPFFITLRKDCVYGIFFDNHYKTSFDMGYSSTEYYSIGAADGELDYYFIYGDTIADVIKGYTDITGRCPLPQLWTLGYHQSRWGYSSQQEVLELADNFIKNDLPCDVIHMDIDYMDNYKVFTVDENKFPDLSGLSNTLQDKGIRLVTIIDPGTKVEKGYHMYDEGVRNHYFAQTPDGDIYENVVWPGDSVFPDYTSSTVRKWWGSQTKFLVDQGIRGIWNDMNEPASFRGPLPDDVVFPGDDMPRLHKEVHNVYGHLMAKATYDGLKDTSGKRPFVITRACYSGSQKYSTAWTGDNQSIWTHLKMSIPQLLNLGMSGMPFVGTDIGGFGSNTTPELLCRWIQASCFAPLFRNHCAKFSRCQEPWQFDRQTLDIYRTYLKLRYRFIPYLYDLFYEESQTGMPIIRPLVMHYQNDPEVYECNDEYLVGDRILVAPVTDQGAHVRPVYLPEGTWVDYWTKERIEGGKYILRDAPLDICPIYIKAGSIIPTWPQLNHIPDGGAKELILEYYTSDAPAEYCHYQDNGTDFSYENGEYNIYHFHIDSNGHLTTSMDHEGYGHLYDAVRLSAH